jgi:AraC-like DNA-binding protein
MQFKIIPIPEILKNDVECIRITQYDGEQPLAINVCLNALPGIVFQHHNGRSPVENITTRFSRTTAIPTLYIYGQMTEPGVMNHKQEPFTTTQIILKPHALQSLLGLNASVLTNNLVELDELSAKHLNMQLLEVHSEEEQLRLLTAFLVKKLDQAKSRDCLIEESLRFIHHNICCVTVKQLLEHLSLSERQFEKRFTQAVGLTPQFYIRVKRFNEAIRLMKTRPFEKLTDVAYHLNYYDQSHFIRDVKAFSGLTPKSLFQKVDFQADQRVIAY